MKEFKYIWIVGLVVTFLIIVVPIVLFVAGERETAVSSPWEGVPVRVPATSHADLIEGTLETGQDVTAVCLECHEDASHQVMDTVHWTWESEPVLLPGRDEPVTIGKKNQINNFCIGIQGNWPGCTRCHAGYGWDSAEYFDTATEENVDCLVCHADTDLYTKGTAGNPVDGVDLVAAAQSVSTPTRENCGSCHFNGGGGNAVKHGDLDESLYFPSEDIDVHMGRYDFQCVDCHQTEGHQIKGNLISVSTSSQSLACADCHTPETIHEDDRINSHLDAVACQTCHIPEGAVRDATKMNWDWSTAGQDLPEDPHTYLKIKGSFVYERGFTPDYIWFNGNADRYLLGDTIDPTQVTVLNQPFGDIEDATAKIWPFKIHLARQIYDSEYTMIIQPMTVGEGGFWTEFDWDLAAQLGSEATGMPYSGSYDFADTSMYWSLTHMVAPKEYALQCSDCHGDNGRMEWQALGYYGDPMLWGGRSQTVIGEK